MATLQVAQLLTDVLDSFKVQIPMLSAFSTDFSNQQAVLGQTLNARIATIPTVQDYVAGSGGYKNGATSANSLLVDVPVVMDQHKHVPIKIPFVDIVATNRDLYVNMINNAAFALGKSIVDAALAKVLVTNVSRRVTNASGAEFNITGGAGVEFDADALSWAKRDMNKAQASPRGRFVMVNSDRYADLDADTRITSRDYYGQKTEGNAYGWIKNAFGFENVWEYPDMPVNGEGLVGFGADKSGIVVASRLPSNIVDAAAQLGVPSVAGFETVQDPDSGLTLLGIKWMEQGTFDLYVTVAVFYGTAVGKQGGSANTITDRGIIRFRSTTGS